MLYLIVTKCWCEYEDGENSKNILCGTSGRTSQPSGTCDDDEACTSFTSFETGVKEANKSELCTPKGKFEWCDEVSLVIHIIP